MTAAGKARGDDATKAALDGLEAALAKPCEETHCAPPGECGPCCDRNDAAVNLSAPLAAVARVAMAYRRFMPVSDGVPLCGAARHSAHYMTALDLHAALDALEAEARKLFGKETT